jgi:hypothetical protein
VTITVAAYINGIPVTIDLDDAALAAIAAALTPAESTDTWPKWMNTHTAARYLDCSTERLRKLTARGQIPHNQEAPGCRVFYSRRAIDQWMESQHREAR